MQLCPVLPRSYLFSAGVLTPANSALKLVTWYVYENNLLCLRWIPGKVMEECGPFPRENEVMDKLPDEVGLS